MTQNRDAPAFQEYAASMMAKASYRVMSLSERGLLYTLRLECWVNGCLPSSPPMLAAMLGKDLTEIKSALPAVMPFFAVRGDQIISPELENYRAHLEKIREKQSVGGKKGADVRYGRKPKRDKASSSIGELQVSHGSTDGSLVKQSPVQQSQNQLSKEADITHEDWLGDYDKASNGY